MIILAEISIRSAPPDFISDGAGVWRFSFAGDTDYVDDDGDDFFWGDRRTIIAVRGVAVGPINYTEVSSVASCQSAEQTFYWDDDNKRLYVHHEDDANDYAIDREIYRILTVSEGYATGRLPGQHQYFDTLYFDPIIGSIGTLQKRADPLKFGLLSFQSSQIDIANADGGFDQASLSLALNSQVRFTLLEAGDTELADGERIFTGYTAGISSSRDRATLRLAEARTIYNRAVCPSVFSSTDYASIDFRYAGRRIPVAYGDVRRGVAVPVDTESFDQTVGGTVTFVVADPALGAVRAIDALYDDNGNSLTLGTINLTNCTVQTSIAADADVDLGRFSWRGEGYDISGTYTNGLDIMKAVLTEQGGVPYLASTYDQTQWAAQTALQTQPLGLSVQSERGLIETIVEPVTVSLQGLVDVLGDGRLTFILRDTEAAIARIIDQDELINDGSEDVLTDEVVSSVVVQYSGSAINDADVLTEIYDDDSAVVGGLYGVEGTQPISPVRSVLTDDEDAQDLGAEVASTSSSPQRQYTCRIALTEDTLQLFDVVQVDIARFGESEYIVCEVLSRGLSINRGLFVVDLVVRELPDRVALTDIRITDDGVRRITDAEAERGLA